MTKYAFYQLPTLPAAENEQNSNSSTEHRFNQIGMVPPNF